MLKEKLKKVLPPDTLRFRVAKKTAVILHLLERGGKDPHYAEWAECTEPLTWSAPKRLKYEPLISVVVPVFNPEPEHLLSMVYSVVNQTYTNWQLVLVDASSEARAGAMTKDSVNIDERIKVITLESNRGIAGNTNAGLESAEGEYVILLDHDDTIAPQALYEVAIELQASPRPQLIYSDEDKLTAENDIRFDPHFKPDWSEHMFRNVNYLNHLTAIEKKLIKRIGGYRKGFDGAQDYELYLRIIDEKPAIKHIPKILYHWRAAESSTASSFSTKKNVLRAGTRALQDHLKRNKLEGLVSPVPKQPGFYKVVYRPKQDEPVAVVVMPGSRADSYAEYISFLAKKVKLAKVKTELFVTKLKGDKKLSVADSKGITFIDDATPSDFLKAVLKKTKAKSFIIINSALVPESNSWVDELAGFVQQCSDVGLAAPLIINKTNRTVVDAGSVYTGEGEQIATPLFKGYNTTDFTYFGSVTWTRSIDETDGHLLAARREVVEKHLATNILRFSRACKSVRSSGLSVVLWPHVQFHFSGELQYRSSVTKYFTPSLRVMRYELGLPRSINSHNLGDKNE